MPPTALKGHLVLLMICYFYGGLNLFEFINQIANIVFLLPYPKQFLYVAIISVCALAHLLKLIACFELGILVIWKKNCFCCLRPHTLSMITFYAALAAAVVFDLYLLGLLFQSPAGKAGRIERITLIVIMILAILEFLVYIPLHKKLNEYIGEEENVGKKYAYLVLPYRGVPVTGMV